jgi:RHS repeat-associated protein
VTNTFTDQEDYDDLGLYNFKARLYDPLLGRFISPDSTVPYPVNPQSFNRYSYCINNPIIYVDPSGESWETIFDVATIVLFGLVGVGMAVAYHNAEKNGENPVVAALISLHLSVLSAGAGYVAGSAITGYFAYAAKLATTNATIISIVTYIGRGVGGAAIAAWSALGDPHANGGNWRSALYQGLIDAAIAIIADPMITGNVANNPELANEWAYGEIRQYSWTKEGGSPEGLPDAKESIAASCSRGEKCNAEALDTAKKPLDKQAAANIRNASGGIDRSGGGRYMCVGHEGCTIVRICNLSVNGKAVPILRDEALLHTGYVTVYGNEVGTIYFYDDPLKGWCSAKDFRAGGK